MATRLHPSRSQMSAGLCNLCLVYVTKASRSSSRAAWQRSGTRRVEESWLAFRDGVGCTFAMSASERARFPLAGATPRSKPRVSLRVFAGRVSVDSRVDAGPRADTRKPRVPF